MAACFSQGMSAILYLTGLILWEGGISADGFERLSHLGISVTKQSVLNLRPALVALGDAALRGIVASKNFYNVGDNFDFSIGRRDKTSDHQGLSEHWFHSLLVSRRIPVPAELLAATQQPRKDILACPAAEWLQSSGDQQLLAGTFLVLAARCIAKVLPRFQHIAAYFADDVFHHIRHPYSEHTSRPAAVVPLGLLLEGEATTAGTLHILRQLMGKIDALAAKTGVHLSATRCMFSGDQLTCERYGSFLCRAHVCFVPHGLAVRRLLVVFRVHVS